MFSLLTGKRVTYVQAVVCTSLIMPSNIQLNVQIESASCLYVRMITQIMLIFSFKHLIKCDLCYNTCTLCCNAQKIFATCPISLEPFLCSSFSSNWSDTMTSIVNWYRGHYAPSEFYGCCVFTHILSQLSTIPTIYLYLLLLHIHIPYSRLFFLSTNFPNFMNRLTTQEIYSRLLYKVWLWVAIVQKLAQV